MNVLVIHGFSSSGERSSKAEQIASILGVRPRCPSLRHRPAQDVASLEKLIRDEGITAIVGTSLGGFYALYLAQRNDLHAIVINPSTNAHELLASRLGVHTVFDTNETFEWTTREIDELATIANTVSEALDPATSRVRWEKTLVLLARNDELIDTEFTISRLPAAAKVVIDEVQTHRFNDLAPYAQAIRELLEAN